MGFASITVHIIHQCRSNSITELMSAHWNSTCGCSCIYIQVLELKVTSKTRFITHHREKSPTACTLLMLLHMNLSRIGHTQSHTFVQYKPLSFPSQHLPCLDSNLYTLHLLQDEGLHHYRQLKERYVMLCVVKG